MREESRLKILCLGFHLDYGVLVCMIEQTSYSSSLDIEIVENYAGSFLLLC